MNIISYNISIVKLLIDIAISLHTKYTSSKVECTFLVVTGNTFINLYNTVLEIYSLNIFGTTVLDMMKE